jgi:hypothetical protein
MGEADPVVGELQQARGDGLVDARLIGERLDRGDRRCRGHRGGAQRAARSARQGGDPLRGHREHTTRQRHRAACERSTPILLRGPGQLDCDERVARAQLVDAADRAQRKREPVLLHEQGAQFVDGERAELDPPVRRAAEAQRWCAVAFDAPRHEHADPFGGEPPHHVAQHPLGRAVEPVDVVDGEQDGCLACKRTDDAERGDAHRVLVGDRAEVVRTQQRDLQRFELRRRELRGEVGDGVEEVPQPDEGQVDLRFDRGGGDDVVAAVAARDGGGPPQRGLADPGVPLQQHPGGPVGDVVEESARRREFDRATDGRRPRSVRHGRKGNGVQPDRSVARRAASSVRERTSSFR